MNTKSPAQFSSLQSPVSPKRENAPILKPLARTLFKMSSVLASGCYTAPSIGSRGPVDHPFLGLVVDLKACSTLR